MPTPTTNLQGTIQTVLGTELNSLANNSLKLGAAVTLTSTGYLLGEVELTATYGVAPTANTGISLWFLSAPDGTNYEDGSDTTTPARAPDLVLPVRAVTTAQRVVRRCILPPGTFKALALNDGTGQTMAASGNTVKVRPYTFQA